MKYQSVATHLAVLCWLIGAAGVTTAGPPVAQEVEPAKVCLLEDRVHAHTGTPRVHQGETESRCCPMCGNAFERAPQPSSKARDPVTGQNLDKAAAPVPGYRDHPAPSASQGGAFPQYPASLPDGAAREHQH